MKVLKWILLIGVVVAVVLGGMVIWTKVAPQGDDPVSPIAGIPHDMPDTMNRGEYLTRAADCFACHSPVEGKMLSGGRPFKLPFGTIYATNLTPDPETGIGNMSDEAFIAAVRDGIGSKGHEYPAMPYTKYSQLSTQDVLDIKAYLMSVEPVNKPTPESDLIFPFNQRWGMALWNAVFFENHRYEADEEKSDEWNRGAYLASALAHCGECHTPRNIGYATKSREYMAGTKVQGWKAFNTTSDGTYGIGDWSDEQLRSYLTTGHAPGRSSASGPMAEVVELSLQYMTDSDIDALMAYLRAVDPSQGGSETAVNTSPDSLKNATAVLPNSASSQQRGKMLFEGDCAGCHQWDGQGRQTKYASLKGSSAANVSEALAVTQVILNGTSISIGERHEYMPGFGSIYSDSDVAALANYVVSHFGGKDGTVTAEDVAETRAQGE